MFTLKTLIFVVMELSARLWVSWTKLMFFKPILFRCVICIVTIFYKIFSFGPFIFIYDIKLFWSQLAEHEYVKCELVASKCLITNCWMVVRTSLFHARDVRVGALETILYSASNFFNWSSINRWGSQKFSFSTISKGYFIGRHSQGWHLSCTIILTPI